MARTGSRSQKSKKKDKAPKIDLDFVKAKLATLQQGERLREAIVYAYYNYLQLVQGIYNVMRRPSQTAREFAMDLVKRVKINPADIYPFTTIYEEARFGLHQIDPNKYNEAIQLFLSLFGKISGGPKEGGPVPPAS